MRLLDGFLIVSASLHAAAAIFYASLHEATRREEHRAVARFSGALALYVLSVIVLEAGLPAAPWSLVAFGRLMMGTVAAAGLVELCAVLAGEPAAAQRRWYGLLLALLLTVYGASFVVTGDLDAAIDAYRWPAGIPILVQSVAVFFLFARSVVRLTRAARTRSELRPIVTAIVAVMCLGLLDEILQWRLGARVHLTEHGAFVVVVASTNTLADRQARAVAELSERSRALEEAHGALASTRQARRQRESLAALGELSAVVAHEVRNPLAIVKNAVSSLRRPALPARDRAVLLDIVVEEAARLSHLVRDLLAFARPRATVPSEVAVHDLVERAVRDVARGSASVAGRVEVDVEVDLRLDGDGELLRLALANVIENALQASSDSGAVRIVARTLSVTIVEIAVSDRGPGMSEEVLRKARDPFFTTRPTGTGLGLAIVDRVVRAHAGEVDIESRVGDGSTVRLRLPREASGTHVVPMSVVGGGR